MAQSLTGGFEMKTYTITVNGTAYDVTVEEGTGSAKHLQHQRQLRRQSTKSSSKSSLRRQRAGAGSVKVEASVPGKVLKIEASVGQSVKAGDNIIILEAMKMEIPVVAPQDGTIASIDVAVGAAVENGDVLATMN